MCLLLELHATMPLRSLRPIRVACAAAAVAGLGLPTRSDLPRHGGDIGRGRTKKGPESAGKMGCRL